MRLVRKIVETLFRQKVLRRKFTLNGRTIKFFYSPDAQLKYLKGQNSWDTDLQALATDHLGPDSVVWDIGANVGVMSFSAALMGVRKVYAFEPDVFLASIVNRTIAENNLGANVSVIPVAVADRAGFATFMIAERGRASNALESAGGRSQMGGTRQSVTVPTVSADDILAFSKDIPTFIKIDVEGAELHVLSGMGAVFDVAKPTVYVEVSQQTEPQVRDFFQSKGYNPAVLGGEAQNLLFEHA